MHMPLRCFIQTQAPVPGSGAQPVHYPACEWVGNDGTVDLLHPLNRFVCSWLTSDMAELSRCDENLKNIAQVEAHAGQTWFADGAMFCVDFKTEGVQFNPSHVGPEDTAWWNLPEGRFALAEVKAMLHTWRDYLAASPQR
jgi:hypothetical protein